MNSNLPPALSGTDRLRWFVGIEDTCVYPRVADAFSALDEHVLTGHTRVWRDDIDRVVGLGVDGLRYGMSWPTVHVAPGRFDWSVLDPILARMHDRGLHVIADLVHYGCPTWLADSFVDVGFVPALTEFALALVDRYGDAIGSVTPINEPLTTASFCGLRTIWPPAIGSKAGWARVAVALAEASQSVIHHVRARAPHIPIVHVEAGHLYETADPTLYAHVADLEMLGDLATDLILGTCGPNDAGTEWLLRRGIAEERLQRLIDGSATPDVFGVNYYPELTPRVVAKHGPTIQQLTVDRWASGLSRVVRHVADRYGLPVLVTETSIEGTEQRRAAWLSAACAELQELRTGGLDVRGLTWWPLVDFVDWSYIADGTSVEEFETSAVDPVTRDLVAVPISTRDRRDGLAAFTRHMGLFALGADDRRDATVAAGRLIEHVGSGAASVSPASCPPAGRVSTESSCSVEITGGWTLTRPDGSEHPAIVPGLWEASGQVELDGTVRYHTTFSADPSDRCWTLRFGAVMDRARVELNGVELGIHDLPYTPFEFDVSGVLQTQNTLIVDVTDPPADSAAHLSSPHGKQGWANHEFPSPPSLYLTYGGIWQPVTLRSHGPVAIRDVRCNLDPADTVVTVELDRVEDASSVGADYDSSHRDLLVEVTIDLGGHVRSITHAVGVRQRRDVEIRFGDTGLPRWSPEDPILHTCAVAVTVGGLLSDESTIDTGLRTVALAHGRLSINDVPTTMRSALVQGFHQHALYAEGSDEDIEHEIQCARGLGFNMLRLHLRPFDPRYLAACDRLGMLVHCDASVAEPIQHDQIDDVGPVARRCADAIAAHVRRDRSHPSIVLWSCMNEIGIDRPSLRMTDRYERFVRRMVATLLAHDTTRPYVENDWIDPSTDRVFCARLATAHWYGHLDREYLQTLELKCARLAVERLPVAVTEFGDWGLPHPEVGAGRFYEHRAAYGRMLGETWWPGTLEEFSASTQEYQGIADRLQIDTIRRSGAAAGYCLTELTDVPWEFNGVLDVERNLKSAAAVHIRCANRTVSPVLSLRQFGAAPGHPLAVVARIVNDSTVAIHVAVSVRCGGARVDLGTCRIDAHHVGELPSATVPIDGLPGPSEVTLTASDLVTGTMWTSTYPMVTHNGGLGRPICVRTVDSAAKALVTGTPWLQSGASEVLLVGEGALRDTAAELELHLERGGVAVVLAQPGGPYPGAHGVASLRSEWGGTPFRYTTDHPVVRAFPSRTVLHVHDADIAPNAIVVPEAPVVHAAVGVFKPPPRSANGLVLAALSVGGGLLVVCQYRLHEQTLAGSATSRAVLGDVLQWARQLAAGAVPPSATTRIR